MIVHKDTITMSGHISGQMSCLQISQIWEMIPGGKLKFTAIGYFAHKIIVELWDVDA